MCECKAVLYSALSDRWLIKQQYYEIMSSLVSSDDAIIRDGGFSNRLTGNPSGTTRPRSIVLRTIDLFCTIHTPQKLATSWGVTSP